MFQTSQSERTATHIMPSERFFAACTKLDRRATAVTVADLEGHDCPLIYANTAFTDLTGYSFDELEGRNCRFLQGHGSCPDAVASIASAITSRRDTAVRLRNYRKDGTPFDNLLILLLIGNPKTTRYVLGCQYVLRPNFRTDQGEVWQGAVKPGDPSSSQIDPVIWSSLIARSDAIRLIFEANHYTVEGFRPVAPSLALAGSEGH